MPPSTQTSGPRCRQWYHSTCGLTFLCDFPAHCPPILHRLATVNNAEDEILATDRRSDRKYRLCWLHRQLQLKLLDHDVEIILSAFPKSDAIEMSQHENAAFSTRYRTSWSPCQPLMPFAVSTCDWPLLYLVSSSGSSNFPRKSKTKHFIIWLKI